MENLKTKLESEKNIENIPKIFQIIELFYPFDDLLSNQEIISNNNELDKILYKKVIDELKVDENSEKCIKRCHLKMLLNLLDKYKREKNKKEVEGKDLSKYEGIISAIESKISGYAQSYGIDLNELKEEETINKNLNEIIGKRIAISENDVHFILETNNTNIKIIDIDNNCETHKIDINESTIYDKNRRFWIRVSQDVIEIAFYIENRTYKYIIKRQ